MAASSEDRNRKDCVTDPASQALLKGAYSWQLFMQVLHLSSSRWCSNSTLSSMDLRSSVDISIGTRVEGKHVGNAV